MEKNWAKKTESLTCKSFHLSITCLCSLYTDTDRKKIKVHLYFSKILVYSGVNWRTNILHFPHVPKFLHTLQEVVDEEENNSLQYLL